MRRFAPARRHWPGCFVRRICEYVDELHDADPISQLSEQARFFMISVHGKNNGLNNDGPRLSIGQVLRPRDPP